MPQAPAAQTGIAGQGRGFVTIGNEYEPLQIHPFVLVFKSHSFTITFIGLPPY